MIFLFRHGETDLTQGRYCGACDASLNARGREQADRIADYLRSQAIAAIYSSPLRRAVQTAEPAARALQLQITALPALRETGFGAWEGLTVAEVRERDAENWRQREADLYSVAPPGGEAIRDLVARVVPAFDDLLARHRHENIAVFGHQSVNRVWLSLLLDMPPAYYRRIGQEPAAVNIVKWLADGVEVLNVNERCHLGISAGDLCRALSGGRAIPGEPQTHKDTKDDPVGSGDR